MDYCLYIGGLAFFLTALLARRIAASGQEPPGWRWLFRFGIAMALVQILDLVAFVFSENPLFGPMLLLLSIVASWCLVEFGRSASAMSAVRIYPPWIVGVVLIAAVHRPGPTSAFHYLPIAVAGFWIAPVLFWAGKSTRRPWLMELAGALVLTAATLLPRYLAGFDFSDICMDGSLMPARREVISGAVEIAGPLALMIAVWRRHRRTRPVPRGAVESQRRHLERRFIIGLIGLLIAGWFGVNATNRHEIRHEKLILLNLAEVSVIAVNPRQVMRINLEAPGETNPDALQVCSQLDRIRASFEGLLRLCLLLPAETRLTVCPASPVSVECSCASETEKQVMACAAPALASDRSCSSVTAPRPMVCAVRAMSSEWPCSSEMTLGHRQPGVTAILAGGGSTVTGPVMEPNGLYFSALAPIRDPETGRLAAVLSLDMAAHDFLHRVRHYRLLVLLIVAILTGWFIFLVDAHRRDMEKDEELRESDSYQESIENTHEILSREAAADLHDSVGQDLTGVNMILRKLERESANADAPVTALVRQAGELARKALEDLRFILRMNYPPALAHNDLVAALNELANRVETIFPIACRLETDVTALPVRNRFVLNQLYRIAQEAITNAVKHGRADRVTLRLAIVDRRLTLEVEDNGSGPTADAAASPGMGQENMRCRAETIDATLTWRSRPEGGMTLVCRTNGDVWRERANGRR